MLRFGRLAEAGYETAQLNAAWLLRASAEAGEAGEAGVEGASAGAAAGEAGRRRDNRAASGDRATAASSNNDNNGNRDSNDIASPSPFRSPIIRRAVRLYHLAAEQGSAEAHLRLGDMYYYGDSAGGLAQGKGWERRRRTTVRNVEQARVRRAVLAAEEKAEREEARRRRARYVKAASHYRRASNLKSAQATFNLGYMHEHGQGVTKDWHLAKRCFDHAVTLNPDAAFPSGLAVAKLFASAYLADTSWFEPVLSWFRAWGTDGTWSGVWIGVGWYFIEGMAKLWEKMVNAVFPFEGRGAGGGGGGGEGAGADAFGERMEDMLTAVLVVALVVILGVLMARRMRQLEGF